MTTPREIIKDAIRLGACEDIHRLFSIGDLSSVTWGELVERFYDPKVLEFCEEKKYPTIDMLSDIPDGEQVRNSLFINRNGETNKHHVLVAGDSAVTVLCSGADEVYKIVLMHGARATVKASDYAVVHIVEIGEGTRVKFVNADNTVIRL